MVACVLWGLSFLQISSRIPCWCHFPRGQGIRGLLLTTPLLAYLWSSCVHLREPLPRFLNFRIIDVWVQIIEGAGVPPCALLSQCQ